MLLPVVMFIIFFLLIIFIPIYVNKLPDYNLNNLLKSAEVDRLFTLDDAKKAIKEICAKGKIEEAYELALEKSLSLNVLHFDLWMLAFEGEVEHVTNPVPHYPDNYSGPMVRYGVYDHHQQILKENDQLIKGLEDEISYQLSLSQREKEFTALRIKQCKDMTKMLDTQVQCCKQHYNPIKPLTEYSVMPCTCSCCLKKSVRLEPIWTGFL